MAHRFISATVVTELTQGIIQTPPSINHAQTYFDQSLVILRQIFKVQKQKMQSQLQTQNDYILEHINELRQDVDKHFQEVEAKMKEQFQHVDKHFQDMDKHFQEIETKMNAGFKRVEVILENKRQARDEANNLTPYNQQKQEALRIIHKLAVFYKMIIYSDEQSKSERTEIDIQENVDVYMKVLLDKWGMD
ncbi:conserved hypothetical protein [Histoplasma capsulatum H143]|uniref:Uncharacterized protein n=1 Tax=Ajellomyces capsulatus (strain H143) TaxID=544712 RepID=C6HGG1_AJECH|nr:conserved hypothetical protein [Histoplasma capsulatum H143]